MQTATLDAVNWWADQRADPSSWIDAYKNSLHQRQRTAISEIVKRYDVSTVFEVGCHCGPNLIRLAQDIPTLTEIFGIDASPQAIQAGTAWAKEAGLDSRVSMSVGRFPEDTAHLASGYADVVISCYTLAYFCPEDLDPALYEIGRLAKRVVILAEPMTSGDAVAVSKTARGYQEYAHSYGKSLKWISSLRGMRLRMLDIDPPIDYLNGVLILERP